MESVHAEDGLIVCLHRTYYQCLVIVCAHLYFGGTYSFRPKSSVG